MQNVEFTQMDLVKSNKHGYSEMVQAKKKEKHKHNENKSKSKRMAKKKIWILPPGNTPIIAIHDAIYLYKYLYEMR